MPGEGECIVESGKIAISETICWWTGKGGSDWAVSGDQIYAVETYQTLPDGKEGIKGCGWATGKSAQGCTERWTGVM